MRHVPSGLTRLNIVCDDFFLMCLTARVVFMFKPSDVVLVNAPLVVSETIEGEAVIMHHGTGRYFDISGSGAIVWQAIEQGATPAMLCDHLAAAHDLLPAQAEAHVATFLETLAAHDLIRTDPEAVASPLPALPVLAAPFLPPALGVHDDLADMLLLDPIHDVDEVGWPAPRPGA